MGFPHAINITLSFFFLYFVKFVAVGDDAFIQDFMNRFSELAERRKHLLNNFRKNFKIGLILNIKGYQRLDFLEIIASQIFTFLAQTPNLFY